MSSVTEEVCNPTNYIDIDNVRIAPSLIEFKNGFEGRNFKIKLIIQNIGVEKAFVRITPPSSYAFKIKAIPNGMLLSPGLSIKRTVRFTYTYMSIQLSFLPIHVNDKRYDIQMIVKQPNLELKFSPDSIDFGVIDSGYSSAMRTLLLENNGNKATRFYVDLTRNRNQIIVEPNKGLLPPKSSIELRLRLMETKEGQLNSLLWIKCDAPFCVPIRGTVIIPSFEAVHPNSTENFTVLDFPTTYFGAKSSQMIMIRNFSHSGAMFCVLGEFKNQRYSFENACDVNPIYNHFEVYPREGTLEPMETKIFHFTFCPKLPKRNEKPLGYYMCIYQISMIQAKHLQSADYVGDIFTSDEDILYSSASRQSFDSPFDVEESSIISNKSLEYETRQANKFVRIYVHGISDTAKVTVLPDELRLANLIMKRQEVRVIEFTNKSEKLPIILRYKKVPYVIMDKNMYFLKPSQKLEVIVKIIPNKIGIIKSQIDFELLYYNIPKNDEEYKLVGYLSVPLFFETVSVTTRPLPQFNEGITPKYVKEVGKFCDDIRFNTSIAKPKAAILDANFVKSNDNIVAFPNDMQKSLRPWRNNTKCTTIFKGIPRYTQPCNQDYELTIFDREFKMEVANYYKNYTRKTADRLKFEMCHLLKKLNTEYVLTDTKLRLNRNLAFQKVLPIKLYRILNEEHFLPLTPAQMNEIVISPRNIETGKIAAHNRYNFKINISNKNGFSIRVVLKPDKPVLVFPEGNRRVIKTDCVCDVDIIYLSSSVGYYNVAIDLIINESMVFTVTLLADVTPKVLKLNVRNLEFEETETHKYIDIYNPLNMHINFFWTVAQSNLTVKPDHGCVNAKNCLTCMVSYLSHIPGPAMTEIEFNSGDKRRQLIRIFIHKRIKLLFLPKKHVNLHNIPLNMPVNTEVLIQNSDCSAQSFTILNPEPIPGISITPTSADVEGNSKCVCVINAQVKSCIHFTCTIKVELEKSSIIEFVVEGNVVYPDISVIPKQIIFKKIPSSCFDVIKFTIENKTTVIASVKIDMSSYPEITLSQSRSVWGNVFNKEIILEALCNKTLFLHFKPLYISSGTFYLPLIVNNIIGPPINTDLITTKVGYFLNTVIPSAIYTPMPITVCCVKVQSYATEPKLCFSKSEINFQYDISTETFNEKYIKILNPQKEPEELCIRTDDLKDSFTLDQWEGKEVTLYDNSIVCYLEPKETVTLKATFQPINSFGDFLAVLPVYLRSDMSTKIHKYLCLRATRPQPTISYENPPLFLKPITLNIKFAKHFTLLMKNHKSDCVMHDDTRLEGITLIFTEKISEKNAQEYKMCYKLIYGFDNPIIFNTNIVFTCNCGSKYELPIVGSAENCYLTNYAYMENFSHIGLMASMSEYPLYVSCTDISMGVQSVKDITKKESCISYPSFPEDKTSIFMDFLGSTLKAAESWICKQAFFGKSFYQIPYGLRYVSYAENEICVPPFANLLLNLAGPHMKKYLRLRTAPANTRDRLLYIHSVYERSLDYLKNIRAFLPQIRAEHLLGYVNYEIYMQYSTSELPVNTMAEEDFNSLSTQAWLDLILQTYKVLVLYRLNVTPLIKSPSKTKDLSVDNNQNADKLRFAHVYSDTEVGLLEWLEWNFNDMKSKIWEDEVLVKKEINDFCHSLQDGLAFAAVTAAYCPYLISYFKRLYIDPGSHAENLHNAIEVTRAWELIEFSFNVSPMDIVNSNSVHMLMLVTYLYEVLPTMYPTEVIEFSIGLSMKMSKSISLKNNNNFTVAFKPIFFDNEEKCFTTNDSTIVLQENHNTHISIHYHAKYLKFSKVFLLLTGECPGYYYAKSKVLTLIGLPDVSYVTSIMTIPTYLYKVYDLTLTCKSPYPTSGFYKLKMTYEQPQNLEDISKIAYITDTPKMTLNRLAFLKKELFFNDEGTCTFDVLICGLNPLDRNIWLYFTNLEIGDFAIQINTVMKFEFEAEVIDVGVPISYSSGNIEENALNVVYLDLQCQNRIFWDTIKEFILRMVEGEELEFWKKHIYTPTGIHILREMLAENNILCMKNVCDKNKLYKIIVPRHACATLPESVIIEDECSSDHIKIPITFKDTATKNFSFTLESEDGLIRRLCTINFMYFSN